MAMARLGSFSFELNTAAFQTLQRKVEYRWEMQNRIGRAPAAQFTGRGQDTIELSGTIYPHFRGGIAQVGAMRAAAEEGEALPLVYAFEAVGQYAGLWVIKSISEERTVFWSNGVPRKIEFSLSLTSYGEDFGDIVSAITPGTGPAVPVAKSAIGLIGQARTSLSGPLTPPSGIAAATGFLGQAQSRLAGFTLPPMVQANSLISQAISGLNAGGVNGIRSATSLMSQAENRLITGVVNKVSSLVRKVVAKTPIRRLGGG